MNIELNKSLLALNTFHIDEYVSDFFEIKNENDLLEAIDFSKKNNKELRILGGGSNILLTQKLDCLLLYNQLKGIEIVKESADAVHIKFMSGENWHTCVRWCVEKNLGGIENLSLIPGTVGAAPIQNIGAYGAELKDVFVQLEAMDLSTLEKKIFTNEECAFGYRDSIFKSKEKNRYFILNVTLQLQKNAVINIEYGDIKKVLEENFNNEISIKNISDAVIKIRTSKLPNPDELGNAGSFFKNPVVSKSQFEELKKENESIPFYEVENGIKIPAAWLIEQCNWKGYNAGEYGVHTRQALVLVNYNNAKGKDILELSTAIITSVQQRFNIVLEREVNIW